jgi:two-component system, LuxR family, sensor kinase FixL
VKNPVLDATSLALGLRTLPAHHYVHTVLTVLLVCAGYYIGGVAGILLGFPPSGIASIWPPTAILLAALFLAPARLWWLYLVAVVFTHLHVVANFQRPEVPVLVMLCQVAANSVHAVLGVLAVRAATGEARPQFDSLKSVATFIVLVAVAATAVVCALAVGLFLVTGWATDFWLAWRQRVLANVFAIVTITPLILLIAAGKAISEPHVVRRYAEFSVIIIGLLAVGIAVFGWDAPAPGNIPALLLAPLPFLLWAAVRLGPGGLCFSLLVVACACLSNASLGRGPFITQSPAENVLSLQIFLIAISLPLMFLAGVIQERREKEEALGESEQRYRSIVEGQTDLVCRFLPDATLTFVNATYARHFGKAPGELIGQSFLTLIPEGQREPTRKHIESLLESQSSGSQEHEVLTPSGEIRSQHWVNSPILDSSGRVVEFQSVGRDITERKRAEAALRRNREELAHMTRLTTMGELAASLAHELNQPLTAILSNAQAAQRFLSGKPSDIEEVREILHDIVEDNTRAGEVIRRMRALVKKGDFDFSSIDLSDIIQGIMSLVHSDAVLRNVRVRLDVDPDLPHARGDKIQLQQVLLNLLLNAFDAMKDCPADGRDISLRAELVGRDMLQISVSDHGTGLTSDQLDKIFQPFFTTKREGLGMGLSISRSIVEAHGGRLWAENNNGHGATFYFTVPAARSAGKETIMNRPDDRVLE